MSSITVALPQELKTKLDRSAKTQHLPKTDIVRNALEQYFTMQELESIRKMVVPRAQKHGFFKDEDVFKAL